jgi:hypothetical protein
MWTLAEVVASSSRELDGERIPWQVDQLTRAVYARTLTGALPPEEAAFLRAKESGQAEESANRALSEQGLLVEQLLTPLTVEESRSALRRLPTEMQQRLTAMSPIVYISDIRAPLVIISHDRDDEVIPVGESRRLYRALDERAGVRYTEFAMFQHADPTKRKLSPIQLVRQLGKFFACLYPMFRRSLDD